MQLPSVDDMLKIIGYQQVQIMTLEGQVATLQGKIDNALKGQKAPEAGA